MKGYAGNTHMEPQSPLPSPFDERLLDRWIDRTLSSEEQVVVDVWLAAHPRVHEELILVRSAVETASGEVVLPAAVARDWAKSIVAGRVGGARGEARAGAVEQSGLRVGRLRSTDCVSVRENSAGRGVGARARVGMWTLRRWEMALGMTALALGIFFLTRRTPEPHNDVTRVYMTTAQQQAVVNLNDGTCVTLAPGSTLRLLRYGAHSRTLVLDHGEAYFEVAHVSGLPFVVRSGAATAQVLGTEFLVRHVTGDPHVRVAVNGGKVRVTTQARPDAGVMLTTGQVGDVTDSTTQVSTTNDLASGMEQEPGRIMFRHTPLATVLQTVTQWYGYHFRYTDQTLSTRSVTMMVSTRSSAEALAALEHVLAVNLTVVGDTITLVSQPPRSNRETPRVRTYNVWIPTREVGR